MITKRSNALLLPDKVFSNLFRKYFKSLLFFSLVGAPLFIHLEKLPVRKWDESRLAINAYEMYHNGHWMVTHYDNKPDMWNTKPPLMIWLQVIGMKIFGVGELALRLPSAIAGLLTSIFLLLFLNQWLKSFWPGFIASLILITSYGYVNVHVTRTGDYDSLLVLFLTAGAFCFFNYLENSSKKQLLLSGLFLWLGIMTKGIHGLLLLPGLLIWVIVQKKFKSHLFKLHFVLTFSGAILLSITYYVIREQLNPGYLNAVWQNEIIGRYFEVNEGNKGDFWFYFDMLSKHHYTNWFWLLPCGLLAGVFSREAVIRKITWFSFIIVLSYGLIISFSKTKLEWYEAPLFPFMAIIISVFVYQVFLMIKNSSVIKNLYAKNVMPWIFLFLLFYNPYQSTLDKVYFPKELEYEKDEYRLSYYLKDALKGKKDVNGSIIFYKGYNAHLLFYQRLLAERKIHVSLTEKPALKTHDIVLVAQEETNKTIQSIYVCDTISADFNLKVYRIIDWKQNP